MNYKLIPIAMIITSSLLIGCSSEKKTRKRREVLNELSESAEMISTIMETRCVSAGEALSFCKNKQTNYYHCISEIIRNNPTVKAKEITEKAIENSELNKILEESEIEKISAFTESLITSEDISEINQSRAIFCHSINAIIDDLDTVQIKKAILKKKLFLLGGLALSIILL